MPNPKHLAKLKEGIKPWNAWRWGALQVIPDLGGADLSSTDLRDVNLSGTNLSGTNLSGANLYDANLFGANLIGADLSNANLSRAILSHSNLVEAHLTGANLVKAHLIGANLVEAHLNEANLVEAHLSGANLYRSNLNKSTLTASDFRTSNLQHANLDDATLSDVKLWETQRAGWSIKGVICDHAYWDEFSILSTEYKPGEFERLHSAQTYIELFYQNGISTFELSTLPALLQHLTSKHPDTNIRLKTVEETGGGAKITISLGNADEKLQAEVQADATQVQLGQLALRESEARRLQLQENYNTLLATMAKTLIAAGTQQNNFFAPVHTAALPSGNATVELHQTFNDNAELIQLIDKLLTRNTELTAAQSVEIEAATTELQKPNPDKSLLTRTLGFLKTLPKEAILKGTGKLGEKAAEADWFNLLHQLGEFIHHLH